MKIASMRQKLTSTTTPNSPKSSRSNIAVVNGYVCGLSPARIREPQTTMNLTLFKGRINQNMVTRNDAALKAPTDFSIVTDAK